jgi:hypothetical protein
MKSRNCYFCGRPATSKEHVPPKSFFPETKEERINLITVPSCDEHNNKKSETNEYMFQYFAASSNLIREEGHFFSTYVRPRAAKSMYTGSKKKTIYSYIDILEKNHKNPKPAFNISGDNGDILSRTYSVELNLERVLLFLESVARGLFYEKFGNIWEERIKVLPYFIGIKNFSIEHRKSLRDLAKSIDKNKSKGNVKSVFYYDISEYEDGHYCVDMCFYDEFKASCIFFRH